MYSTRSEAHQHEKRRRKKKFRLLLTVNLMMVGLIVVLVAVWASMQDGGIFHKDSKPQTEETAANGDPAANQSAAGNEPEVITTPVESAAPDEGNTDEAASEGTKEDDNPSGQIDPSPTPGDSSSAGAGAGDTVSLAFVGDILLAESVGDMMKQYGDDYPYKEALFHLSEPDLTAANLEYPVTSRGIPAEDKQFVFKGDAGALPALKDSGIDIVSLANNHTLDQGVEGLLDTMSHLDKAGIKHMGAGKNDTEAFAPVIKEAQGIKIAYIGVSRVVPTGDWKADKNRAGVAETYDYTRTKAAIKKAKEKADLVVVMVHWGIEKAENPEQYQRDFARVYIDSGADLVIGSHPHVLQGFEQYKGKWIAYSLGNFIFSAYPKGATADTGVLNAVCTKSGDCDLKFAPMNNNLAQPKPVDSDKAKTVLSRLNAISFGVKVRGDGTVIPK
ncbi:poly-gamma-glutamate synthesis protein (capsule biosynthesis protein) [Paenibacillus catalpae]|uniref:Poly-gamma-glutamate synthesis protein (Capsule biosynthesis protein) n=1 Tax=Paenibacillus catalpae TaxID=1045775 RepID=A0A1I2EZG5_9BACL|nr:CapA family protein [Paenibacillus catalpae]SFE97671.1 poly-gamma-glutamate synthesis protein (capsule biosynthesis protein) [Paenibacillus catalpae]